MKLSNIHKFILVVGGQALLILLMVGLRFMMFNGGADVLLKINPVDPRDPLRGDYVTFTYDIGIMDTYMVEDISQYKKGDTVYVTLYKYDGYINDPELIYRGDRQFELYKIGVIKEILLEKPSVEELFLQGTIVGEQVRDGRNVFVIEYGIEEYFIPEGRGQNLWNENLDNVFAHVKINEDGRAQLEQIYKDGYKWPSAGVLKGN